MSKVVKLKKNEEHRIVRGHLWAFSNEIAAIEGTPEAGDIVALQSHAGKFLGTGFYNPHSLIAVRLLSHEEEEIDFQFFRKRIGRADGLRKRFLSGQDSYRVVDGESDYLPGLVIDRYNHHFSVQTFSSGMDRRLTLICDVLDSLFHPAGIVERNDTAARSLEGLPQRKGCLRGGAEPVTIVEHGLRYTVDLLEGQKTGFFLDQRDNRHAIRRYVKGGRVLDCFCNDGGFALNAAAGGAREVTGVDVSESAVGRAAANAAANKLDGVVRFQARDVFELLREGREKHGKFDVIVLDPPSFTKSRKTVQSARQGYKELHLGALALLEPGGILATASCSHHLYDETFLEIVTDSARSAGRGVTQLEWHGAAPDHPVLPAMPETRYLKFGIFAVD